MKITTLAYLDEIIAEHLSYKQYSFNYLKGWVPPEIYKDNNESKIDYWLWSNCVNNLGLVEAPKFSTDYNTSQKIVEYVLNIKDEHLDVNTWQTKTSSWAAIYDSAAAKRWTGFCGVEKDKTDLIDYPINSLPLAICIAFLKYKNIKIELQREGT